MGADAQSEANARLRAAVDAVTRERNPTRRSAAAAALRRAAENEMARIRHEARRWARDVVEAGMSRLREAAASADASLGDVLEQLAAEASDVSDSRFDNFRATQHDVAAVRGALRRRAGAPWVVSYLVLRTGAFDQTAIKRPSTKQVATMQEALRKTPRA
jgi:hypothetical protein